MRHRRLAALGIMAAILVALGAANASLLLSPEQLRRRLTGFVGRFIRGDVELEGIRPRLLSRLRVKRGRLEPLAEGTGRPEGDLRFRNLIVEHSTSALLLGEYRVVRVAVAEMVLRFDDPIRLLETVRSLLRSGSASGPDSPAPGEPPAPAPPISIDRLVLVYTGGPIPLTHAPTGGEEGVVFERVEIRPERTAAHESGWRAPSRRYEFQASYRAGPMQALEVRGSADMGAATLTLDLTASNLDLRGRNLEGLSPDVVRWFAALGPSGPIDLTMSLEVPWRRLDETSLSGEAEAYNVTLAPQGFPRPITHVSGRVSFRSGRIRIESLRGIYGPGEVQAHGTVAATGKPDAAGAALEIEGTELDLAELCRLPLPGPYARAIAALTPEGRASGRLRLERDGWGTGTAKYRFRGDISTSGARALEGALTGMAAHAWFAGEANGTTCTAVGSLRMDGAEVEGFPIRGAIAKLAVCPDGIRLTEGEGRAGAGGTFLAAAKIGMAPTRALSLDVAARDIALAPIASAFYDRAVLLDATGTGTLSMVREAGAPAAEVRADLEIGPLDPGPLPAYAPLGEALAKAGLPAGRYLGGRLRVLREASGGGTASLVLTAPTRALSVALAFDSAGNVSGTADAGAVALVLSGPLASPAVTTATAAPAAPTATATPASK